MAAGPGKPTPLGVTLYVICHEPLALMRIQ
ncbi:hypothetical protein NSND_61161 [Nitrospira sp. ND1]|nr:hypothetical protein NSND_61161 [Nitrospira sp. ND1]